MFRPVGLRRGWDEDYFGSYGIRVWIDCWNSGLFQQISPFSSFFGLLLFLRAFLVPEEIELGEREREDESLKKLVTIGAPFDLFQTLVKSHCKYSAYSITEASGICSLAHYGQEQLKNVSISLCALRFKVYLKNPH
ncbi:unnamed protein product [Onchocerca flexuosa]|uniref:Uncharacterized protein n=1 Tax=Onchocerca flexuosa TaxID=387005 RepID=A0A183H2R1_9BILA|nr:unnamed protein product [Onchocerca flexuosa]